MKIAYLINQYPKPSHTFIRREIQALERLGVEVIRISIRGWNDELVDAQDEKERQRTKYVLKGGALALTLAVLNVLSTSPRRLIEALTLATRLAFNRSERPLLVHLIYVAEACQVLLWTRQLGVQHLHAHFGTNSADVAMLTHVLGGPSWSMTVHGPTEFDRKPLLNLPEKIKRSSFVVAISSYGRSQLFRLVGQEQWHKIHVVHCGLEREFYSSSAPSATVGRRFVCVGRLSEAKGQLLLIEAVKRLRDNGIDFELVLAGDGEMRQAIEKLVAKYNLATMVRLTGWISTADVREEILASRALVLPSFAEGLPVVIMEAMALKRPVLATYIAGIPELVRSGEHGWLIPAGDIDALSDALQRVLETPLNSLFDMGNSAFQQVRQNHDVDIEAAKLHALIGATIKYDRPGPVRLLKAKPRTTAAAQVE
ncbi:glycosyltransferase [Bradyrhizobium sp. WYCCWR 13023]|uniref:Glycosyltransferase n=1 Tax=Bradyrhizobium zhengyangense TaxID=2911009 RepID=A0A9X1RJV6_9BRAD|nr:glycosyltransferase [Bradyrhizobium zhengyangense]MCG2632727.1 glycosyltransferase [Bradyrhizobium zhengyangense]